MLSQLSYRPPLLDCWLVGLGRVELPTSPLSGARSSQLSYGPYLISQAHGAPAGVKHKLKSRFKRELDSTCSFDPMLSKNKPQKEASLSKPNSSASEG